MKKVIVSVAMLAMVAMISGCSSVGGVITGPFSYIGCKVREPSVKAAALEECALIPEAKKDQGVIRAVKLGGASDNAVAGALAVSFGDLYDLYMNQSLTTGQKVSNVLESAGDATLAIGGIIAGANALKSNKSSTNPDMPAQGTTSGNGNTQIYNYGAGSVTLIQQSQNAGQ